MPCQMRAVLQRRTAVSALPAGISLHRSTIQHHLNVVGRWIQEAYTESSYNHMACAARRRNVPATLFYNVSHNVVLLNPI